jgi:hypothetical protein
MSGLGSVLGAGGIGGGLGALDDAVGAIESALGGVSDVLKAADGLKVALKGFAEDGASALKSLAKFGGCCAMDHMGPMIDKLAGEIGGRIADGKLSPGDKAAIKESLADAGFDNQSQHKVMDSIQKMMLDGLTETMKKRHDGKGGGDSGKAAAAEGGGGSGGGGSVSGSSSGGVSIGDIARVLGEALNEQFKKLVDAANALGSDPTAQQTAQLQALSAQVNANAGALTNAQRSAEEALKAIARA